MRIKIIKSNADMGYYVGEVYEAFNMGTHYFCGGRIRIPKNDCEIVKE